jgi:hypothetical protein
MGISDRIEDARFLWQQGRRESGLLLVCTAVTARASSEYPGKGDREAFGALLQDSLSMRISTEFRGEQWPIEHLLYKWVRCQLVHNASIPMDIVIDDELGNELALRAGGAPEYVLKLSPGWFSFLINVASQKN